MSDGHRDYSDAPKHVVEFYRENHREQTRAVALAKAEMACGFELPTSGSVFLSVRDSDKTAAVDIARNLVSMGFTVYTTGGTNDFLRSHTVETELMPKISEGARPNILDRIANGEIDLLVNTPTRKGADTDDKERWM